MPIKVHCAGCGKSYNLKDELAGKKIRCPNCKEVIAVGAAAPKPVKAADVARPPKKTITKQRPPVDDDPNATAYRESPQPQQQDIPAGNKLASASQAAAATCPSCGKAMKARQLTCSSCGFNIKLNRKLSITDAIRKTDVAAGVRHDGTRYVTRAEKTEQRAERGQKIQKGIIIFAIAIVVMGIVATCFVYQKIKWGVPLEELRLGVLPRQFHPGDSNYKKDQSLTKLNWLHPYAVGMDIDIEIPLDEIRFEDCTEAANKESGVENIGTVFAEACRLPYAKTIKMIYPIRINEKIDELGGNFTPAELSPSPRIPGDILALWRLSGKPEQVGYLSGAVLDFDKDPGDVKKVVEGALKEGKTKISVRGKLSFVISNVNLMSKTKYSYAQSLRENVGTGTAKVDRIPPAPEGTGDKVVKDENPPEISIGFSYYFHPVFLIENYSLK